MSHDKPPKKPHILSDEESLKYVRSAQGTDVIHSFKGAEAARKQLEKGPEGRRTLKDTATLLTKILEKEIVVDKLNDQLLFKYETYLNMYENKATQLSLKENELYTLGENLTELKEKIKATKEVDDYIRKNKPELYEAEHKKMDVEREKIFKEETSLKIKIEEFKNNIKLDKEGLNNLQKKIVGIAEQDDIIHIQKQ